MIALFCSNPLNPREVDEDYRTEYAAARNAGMSCQLFSYEALVDYKNPEKAVSQISDPSSETSAVYRGWMLTPDQYAGLFSVLAAKGISMITSPENYRLCHWLPEWYPLMEGITPKSAWIPSNTLEFIDTVHEQLALFGNHPVVIKDYVKSQKHKWAEACFIPNASNTDLAMRVVQRFLELQGDELQGGLVVREFVELTHLTHHSKSGMPLSLEYRVFYLHNRAMQVIPYWEEGQYSDKAPDLSAFDQWAARINSPLFSMDLARKSNGDWIIMELGDGQVSALPDQADIDAFYQTLARNGDDTL